MVEVISRRFHNEVIASLVLVLGFSVALIPFYFRTRKERKVVHSRQPSRRQSIRPASHMGYLGHLCQLRLSGSSVGNLLRPAASAVALRLDSGVPDEEPCTLVIDFDPHLSDSFSDSIVSYLQPSRCSLITNLSDFVVSECKPSSEDSEVTESSAYAKLNFTHHLSSKDGKLIMLVAAVGTLNCVAILVIPTVEGVIAPGAGHVSESIYLNTEAIDDFATRQRQATDVTRLQNTALVTKLILTDPSTGTLSIIPPDGILSNFNVDANNEAIILSVRESLEEAVKTLCQLGEDRTNLSTALIHTTLKLPTAVKVPISNRHTASVEGIVRMLNFTRNCGQSNGITEVKSSTECTSVILDESIGIRFALPELSFVTIAEPLIPRAATHRVIVSILSLGASRRAAAPVFSLFSFEHLKVYSRLWTSHPALIATSGGHLSREARRILEMNIFVNFILPHISCVAEVQPNIPVFTYYDVCGREFCSFNVPSVGSGEQTLVSVQSGGGSSGDSELLMFKWSPAEGEEMQLSKLLDRIQFI